jgi:hypothetical protein
MENIQNDIENDFDNIYKQFILDLPRLDLYLDSYLCNKDHQYVKEYLEERLDNVSYKIAIFMLTQTFLAKFFADEYKKRMSLYDEHLLDNHSYVVNIDTISKIISISKDFKILYLLDNESEYVVDFCTLNINFKLKNMTIFYYWDYFFKKEEPKHTNT